jgi:hypothetical protein
MNWQPRRTHPVGHTPDSKFFDTNDWGGSRIGLVTRVDEVNMKADVKLLTGGGYRLEVDLTQAMAGPRSFWGGVPEVNSLVVIGFRRIHKNLNDAVILGYLPVGNRTGSKFDPFDAADRSSIPAKDLDTYNSLVGPTVRYKRLMMRPGNVGGMSSEGAELLLNKDIAMVNRAGDLLELRDSERTFVVQAVHREQSESGVRYTSGPIRRSAHYLPEDILNEDGTLKDVADEYYGRDELQAAGPGPTAGGPNKYADNDGNPLEVFNDYREFPPSVYSSGRMVYFPVTLRPDLALDDPDSPADAFVENRMELFHTSNLTPEVTEEVDGFTLDRRNPYIERVYGTIVGNTLNTTRGQRNYSKILKPVLFDDFESKSPGKFKFAEVNRLSNPDEAHTNAGAFLFRIRPPRAKGDNEFVAAVTKEGKAYLNIPASSSESYSGNASNVSAEVNLQGALKAYLGASTPDRISAHITMAGGLHLDIGRDAKGNVITTNFKGAVRQTYTGNPNEGDAAVEVEVKGIDKKTVTGAVQRFIQGSRQSIVSGIDQTQCDRRNVNAFGGYSLNAGEMNQMISGKTQLNYALAVLENIITGGKITTILAGGQLTQIFAGALVNNVLAGATSFSNPAGAFNVIVGVGAINATVASGAIALSTAAGAMSLAASGAVAITAGLSLNLSAGAVIAALAASINLGGGLVPGVLGVCRGIPILPQNIASLDPITGIPLQGAALVMSS